MPDDAKRLNDGSIASDPERTGGATPIVVVSNELPISARRTEDGTFVSTPATGRLMRTVAPVLRQTGGAWVGWHGLADAVSDTELNTAPVDFRLVGVTLDEADVAAFSDGFCRGALWPLLHDSIGRASFHREQWQAYCEVNARFAEAALPYAEHGRGVFVQDYEMIKVGEELRRRRFDGPIQFCLHASFPSLDVFRRIPWRRQLLWPLLAYDVVTVQNRRALDNMIACLRALVPEIEVTADGDRFRVKTSERVTTFAAIPCGVDWSEFDGLAREREVDDAAWLFTERFGEQKVLLGIDRLDYMKGIHERIAAYECFLDRHPEWRERVVLHQIALPVRGEIAAYRAHERNLDERVGHVNGRFSTASWSPIHYRKARLSHPELLAAYRTADVMMLMSLREGDGITAKEFVAASVDGRGTVIVSEFAGVAETLGPAGALVVNPHDAEGCAHTLSAALEMPDDLAGQALVRMREIVRQQDAMRWGNLVLGASRLPALQPVG